MDGVGVDVDEDEVEVSGEIMARIREATTRKSVSRRENWREGGVWRAAACRKRGAEESWGVCAYSSCRSASSPITIDRMSAEREDPEVRAKKESQSPERWARSMREKAGRLGSSSERSSTSSATPSSRTCLSRSASQSASSRLRNASSSSFDIGAEKESADVEC